LGSESWVFASPVNQGRWPYLAQQIMRHHILPVARKLGITKRIGWHTFRHTYSTLLRSTGAELKGHAGTAASFDNSRDARYVHAGGHSREAYRARGRRRAIVPRKNTGNVGCASTESITCTYFVPFCARAKIELSGKCLKEIAGTTRLELATSAVTETTRHGWPPKPRFGTLGNNYWTMNGPRKWTLLQNGRSLSLGLAMKFDPLFQ
jgi:hypothetical protein